LVAPAHVGSPCMLPNLAHGIIGNTANMLPSSRFMDHLESGMSNISSSWPCMPAEMPMMVGDISPYPADHVFARTPNKVYTMGELSGFLADVAGQAKDRDIPSKLWPGIQEIYAKIRTPEVPTHIIYADQLDTITEVAYDTDDVTQPCVETVTEMGDGTITAAAIETVADEWICRGADVHLVRCPEKVNHKNLIVDDFTVLYVQDLMGGFETDSEYDSDSDSDYER